ncbi:BZ3500_MvSof-1268-A1-R1_Chr10-2g02928 [Microbotryum saponariae]|uniref:BZ3500_MvSof-1268-A1-R1_Chr10-2g02928 protein n=1 Tax=Microbotryum saponariae TaxID=289078 RepID=A0A2X0L9N6_9BASI|nr:BZ3501_MvSof-1269-A2-R1_Chr10-2g02514 [Microbotryum saponariae]SDA01760.1 BZ3500_MvSof-1268-A1-R1_Chr10-2g02928 [Microbotryum saponariae]
MARPTTAWASELDLQPGIGLGPFHIGTTLFDVINLLRSHRSTYPTVHLAWDDKAPSTSSIHIQLLKPSPLALLFDATTQRLLRIQLEGQATPSLIYRGKPFTHPSEDSDHQDAKTLIRRLLGPTYSSSSTETSSSGLNGQPSAASTSTAKKTMMTYPGVSFELEERNKRGKAMVTPLLAPESNIPIDTAWLHPSLPNDHSKKQGQLGQVEIMLDAQNCPTSVKLVFYPHDSPSTSHHAVEFKIGESTSEDIMCDLGSAVRSFWKEDDRMSIHSSPDATALAALDPNPYFLSYPSLGITFLVHGSKHHLLKVILHSNLPGEVNFGRTHRCRWALVDSSGARIGCEQPFTKVKTRLVGGSPRPGSPKGELKGEKDDLTAKKGVKGFSVEKPMILDRTAGGGEGSEVKGKTTEIHGFPGVAFEVTISGDVETVWLF